MYLAYRMTFGGRPVDKLVFLSTLASLVCLFIDWECTVRVGSLDTAGASRRQIGRGLLCAVPLFSSFELLVLTGLLVPIERNRYPKTADGSSWADERRSKNNNTHNLPPTTNYELRMRGIYSQTKKGGAKCRFRITKQYIFCGVTIRTYHRKRVNNIDRSR